MTKEKITSFKAFNSDWTCRGFQYEVGKSYEHDGSVSACNSGFHACENPFDCWSYYDLTDAKFAKVTQTGDISRHGSDSKIASGKITIEAELSMPELIRAGVDWVIAKAKGQEESSGDYAKIGSSGNRAQIGISGYDAKICSSGDCALIGSGGDYAKIGSSGNRAQIGSSGNRAQIGSSGDCAQIESTGKKSVVATAGNGARVKGAVGTWISVAEFAHGECVGFATGCIGQDGLKPDVWYRAKGGNLVEATQ